MLIINIVSELVNLNIFIKLINKYSLRQYINKKNNNLINQQK